MYLNSYKNLLHIIKNHIPLKQGLRRHIYNKSVFKATIKNHIPLKQGLRLFSDCLPYSLEYFIKNHIPLKQGLRPARAVPPPLLHD